MGGGGGRCFTLTGAALASGLARDDGWPEDRCRRVAEAVTLHLNPAVGPAEGAEAHLLHAGASLDVIGTRLSELDRVTVAAVLAAHPRLGFRREFAALWRVHCRDAPRGRANFLRRYGGFGLALRLAPFADR